MRRLLTTVAALAVVAFAAPAAASFLAQPGFYSGFSGGTPIHFHYDHGKLTNFSVGGHIRVPDAPVHNASFDHLFGHRILKGHWTSDTQVSGTYSYLREVRGGYIRQEISWHARRSG